MPRGAEPRGSRRSAKWEGQASDPAFAAAFAQISSDTMRRLRIYADLLRKWQQVINLVSAKTLDDLWIRHFADSLQVSEAVPDARLWLDLGSGAGFPGLVTAIRYADEPGSKVHLIEADRRKCAFLREVSRETATPAIIHCGRIEDIAPSLADPIQAVSARALAPLATLVHYADRFIENGAIGVFSKGKQVEAELTECLTTGKYLITTIHSQTQSTARLVIVRHKKADSGDSV